MIAPSISDGLRPLKYTKSPVRGQKRPQNVLNLNIMTQNRQNLALNGLKNTLKEPPCTLFFVSATVHNLGCIQTFLGQKKG